MCRFLILLLVFSTLISCSKKDAGSTPPPDVIPNSIDGVITEFNAVPLDSLTPDKGSLLIEANNTIYKAEYSATEEPQSNAVLSFKSDTILTDDSREFTNLGKDAVSYNPVRDNEIIVSFKDGREISGSFAPLTNFGGVFGEQLISRWRDPADPAKPNQKVKEDIRNFVQRYADKDGPGPGTAPVYFFVTVTRL